MKEIWKHIEGYEDYMISNLGRVKSNQSYNNPKHEWRYLTPSDNSRGYKLVGLVKVNIYHQKEWKVGKGKNILFQFLLNNMI